MPLDVFVVVVVAAFTVVGVAWFTIVVVAPLDRFAARFTAVAVARGSC